MILFISDLHLQEKEPIKTSAFFHLLQNEAEVADALYILGDLFEICVGDDDPSPLYRETASAIKMLVNSGVPCYFTRGNRDFLIGERFAQESGMILLPEEYVLNLYGHRILIMHGTTLCSDDVEYQSFHTKVRTPWVQKIFLSLPLFIRIPLANKIRAKSKAASQNKSSLVTNINLHTAVKIMEKHHVQWLICGHVHRRAVYEFTINGKPAFCIVLDAWWRNSGFLAKMTPKCIESYYFSFF